MKSNLKLFFLLCLIAEIFTHEMTQEEINKNVDDKIITCGSALRIQNVMTKFNLFSNKLTWGSGSFKQIITAIKETDNNDSLFLIKEGDGDIPCETGSPIKCNSVIRVEHANTGKNLHSHNFPSYITDSQEACGFGERGTGDVNDNFRIMCYNSKDDKLKGSTQFFLQHESTKQFLYINIKKSLFNEYNCRGCPIMNHREVSLTPTKDKQCMWKIIGGIIYQSNSEDEKDHIDYKINSSADL